jgi:multidrug efflux pump subunit AcrA (membrane-fusion protein)
MHSSIGIGRRSGTLLAALALLAAAPACDQASTSQTSPQQPNQAALPAVVVSQPLARDIIDWDEYTGRFDAVETVEVRARVSGYLTGVHFTDGQTVSQGDLLFVIDPRPFERTLEQAKAELEQASTKAQNAPSTWCAASRWSSGALCRRRRSTIARTCCAKPRQP